MCILNDKKNEVCWICEAEDILANSLSSCCVSVNQLRRWLSVYEKVEGEECSPMQSNACQRKLLFRLFV